MTILGWTCLIAVFFLTAVISVVTGGTSLITVPVLMQFGIEPHVAVSANSRRLKQIVDLHFTPCFPALQARLAVWAMMMQKL